MAEDSKTMQVDPRVALQETAAKADADAAWYRNRCLLLAQRVFDQDVQLRVQAERIEHLDAQLGAPAIDTQES